MILLVNTDTSGTTNGSGMGTLSFQFAMDTDYMAAMDEPAEGNFLWSLYLGEDVTGIGPVEGAVSLASLDVENIVLPTDGSSTEIMISISDLPVTEVVVLGFWIQMKMQIQQIQIQMPKILLPYPLIMILMSWKMKTQWLEFILHFKSFLGDFYYDTSIFLILFACGEETTKRRYKFRSDTSS